MLGMELELQLLQRWVIEPYSITAHGNNVLMGQVERGQAVNDRERVLPCSISATA